MVLGMFHLHSFCVIQALTDAQNKIQNFKCEKLLLSPALLVPMRIIDQMTRVRFSIRTVALMDV